MSIAQKFKDKKRTEDVLISESVDFAGLLLSKPVLQGLTDAGFQRPSPVQLKAIPLGRCGLDLIVQAKSGTGKTCVFTVVALESLDVSTVCVQVLVLAPTREIALQIQEVIRTIGTPLSGLKCHTFIGGLPVLQDKILAKNCHMAIGTPGRVKQLIEIGALKTSNIRLFVLDEADKLLEGDFQKSINWIYSTLPENKQILALSATYPEYLAHHLTAYMRNPTFVRLNITDPALIGIKQYHVVVPNHPMPNIVFNAKTEAVVKILSSVTFQQCLIFSNMQTRAQNLQSELQLRNWPTACIAGCLDQKERNFAMEQLKTYKCRILISTDLTSRGIDADKVNLVINMDVPPDHETYLHRIGRAGRFGSYGAAITIVSSGGQDKELWAVEKKVKTYIHKLPEPIPNDLVTKPITISLDDVVSTQQIINHPDADTAGPLVSTTHGTLSARESLDHMVSVTAVDQVIPESDGDSLTTTECVPGVIEDGNDKPNEYAAYLGDDHPVPISGSCSNSVAALISSEVEEDAMAMRGNDSEKNSVLKSKELDEKKNVVPKSNLSEEETDLLQHEQLNTVKDSSVCSPSETLSTALHNENADVVENVNITEKENGSSSVSCIDIAVDGEIFGSVAAVGSHLGFSLPSENIRESIREIEGKDLPVETVNTTNSDIVKLESVVPTEDIKSQADVLSILKIESKHCGKEESSRNGSEGNASMTGVGAVKFDSHSVDSGGDIDDNRNRVEDGNNKLTDSLESGGALRNEDTELKSPQTVSSYAENVSKQILYEAIKTSPLMQDLQNRTLPPFQSELPSSEDSGCERNVTGDTTQPEHEDAQCENRTESGEDMVLKNTSVEHENDERLEGTGEGPAVEIVFEPKLNVGCVNGKVLYSVAISEKEKCSETSSEVVDLTLPKPDVNIQNSLLPGDHKLSENVSNSPVPTLSPDKPRIKAKPRRRGGAPRSFAVSDFLHSVNEELHSLKTMIINDSLVSDESQMNHAASNAGLPLMSNIDRTHDHLLSDTGGGDFTVNKVVKGRDDDSKCSLSLDKTNKGVDEAADKLETKNVSRLTTVRLTDIGGGDFVSNDDNGTINLTGAEVDKGMSDFVDSAEKQLLQQRDSNSVDSITRISYLSEQMQSGDSPNEGDKVYGICQKHVNTELHDVACDSNEVKSLSSAALGQFCKTNMTQITATLNHLLLEDVNGNGIPSFEDLERDCQEFCDHCDSKSSDELKAADLLSVLESESFTVSKELQELCVYRDIKLKELKQEFEAKLQVAEKERKARGQTRDRRDSKSDSDGSQQEHKKNKQSTHTEKYKPPRPKGSQGPQSFEQELYEYQRARQSQRKKRGKSPQSKGQKPSDSLNWRSTAMAEDNPDRDNRQADKLGARPGMKNGKKLQVNDKLEVSSENLSEREDSQNTENVVVKECAINKSPSEHSDGVGDSSAKTKITRKEMLKQSNAECRQLDDMHAGMLKRRQERKAAKLKAMEDKKEEERILQNATLDSTNSLDGSEAVECVVKGVNAVDDSKVDVEIHTDKKGEKDEVMIKEESTHAYDTTKLTETMENQKQNENDSSIVRARDKTFVDKSEQNQSPNEKRHARRKLADKGIKEGNSLKSIAQRHNELSRGEQHKMETISVIKSLSKMSLSDGKSIKPSKSEARLAGIEVSDGSTSSTSELTLSSTSDLSDVNSSDDENRDIILKSQCYANKYADDAEHIHTKVGRSYSKDERGAKVRNKCSRHPVSASQRRFEYVKHDGAKPEHYPPFWVPPFLPSYPYPQHPYMHINNNDQYSVQEPSSVTAYGDVHHRKVSRRHGHGNTAHTHSDDLGHHGNSSHKQKVSKTKTKVHNGVQEMQNGIIKMGRSNQYVSKKPDMFVEESSGSESEDEYSSSHPADHHSRFIQAHIQHQQCYYQPDPFHGHSQHPPSYGAAPWPPFQPYSPQSQYWHHWYPNYGFAPYFPSPALPSYAPPLPHFPPPYQYSHQYDVHSLRHPASHSSSAHLSSTQTALVQMKYVSHMTKAAIRLLKRQRVNQQLRKNNDFKKQETKL